MSMILRSLVLSFYNKSPSSYITRKQGGYIRQIYCQIFVRYVDYMPS